MVKAKLISCKSMQDLQDAINEFCNNIQIEIISVNTNIANFTYYATIIYRKRQING